MKNAPAVTARRATNQIVLVAEHQALAAIVVVILPAVIAAATLAIVVVVVIVLAEQTVRVVTMRLIDHVVTMRLIDRAVTATGHTRRVPPVMANAHILRGLHAMAIAHIHRARFVTEMPDRAVMAHRLIDLVAMVWLVRRARLAIVPIPRGLHAMAIARIQRVPLVTEILGRRVPVAIALTRLGLLAMVIHVRVAMARTALVSLVAMAIRAAGLHVAMAILLVVLLALAETAPIRRAPRATARVLTVREAIGHTATSRAVSGSPMGESVVRSARR